jgi:hypothetical protein
MEWVNGIKAAKFGDARLSKRLNRIVDKLTENPERTLPEAMGNWRETKATYRFLDNAKVKVSSIYESQRLGSVERMGEEAMILGVQDTMVLNYTNHGKTTGLGPICHIGSQRGYFLHSCLGVTLSGVPFGLLGQRMWVRDQKSKNSRKTRKSRTNEEKESVRWVEVAREVREVIPPSTKVVMLGDRESDIYEVIALALEGHDLLIRAAMNRCVQQREGYLWQAAENAPVLGRETIVVPRGDEKPERKAAVTLQSTTVTINPPTHRKKEKLPAVTVNALLIREVSCPEGDQNEQSSFIEWLLLTTLPVSTLEDAVKCMIWYSYRWRIERYHYTLKSGCHVEKLQLETSDRLMRALAVYSIVALRLIWLTYQARLTPDLPCSSVFSDTEWKTLFIAVHKSRDLPVDPPTLHTAVLWVAKLGGFLARKGDGSPGVLVLWRGLRKLFDLVDFSTLFSS